ncbi:hypothetical protein ACFXNW_12420 [Nocardia sp. NPDC059180]|uniref:hypothetical protein n=1 Tax=Nocardia sp. NPDC059180 TaxID=3346761 RepID=UPI00368B8EB5
MLRRLVSGLLPLGLLVGLLVANVPDGDVAAVPASVAGSRSIVTAEAVAGAPGAHRQPRECAIGSTGSACVLAPLLRGLVRTAPLPRTPSGSR